MFYGRMMGMKRFTEVKGMSISRQDVEHVAALARLQLTENEKAQFTEQLNAILSFAEKLNELDTDGVEPTTHVLPLKNVMREDESRPSLDQKKVLRNAPEAEDGHFKVPAVLE
jgi:aspartyl-tRNA(Asn)/glutamyl-tRNA(Gln) amidotransferase subunit C